MDHDHDYDHGADDTVQEKTCKMIMVFHGGHCERILWKGWVAYTVTEFAFSCIALFFMAMFYEALKFLREYLHRRYLKKEAERAAIEMQSQNLSTLSSGSHTQLAEMRQKTYWERITTSDHLTQTFINMFQIIISYLLMLVFMNFNYWLCLSMLLGLTFGYFFFGWIRTGLLEQDCCQ